MPAVIASFSLSAFAILSAVRYAEGKKARKGDIYLRELEGKRGKFKVTVVAHMSDGTIVTSKRTYRGCKKTPPKTTVVRPSQSR